MKKLFCLFLALCMAVGLLSGCMSGGAGDPVVTIAPKPVEDIKQNLRQDETAYKDMKYTRPDMERLEQLKTTVCDAAKGSSAEQIIEFVYDFYEAYHWFYTNYNLADIHYCTDLTDSYWEEEYTFCVENSARVEALMEELQYALAASPACDRLEEDYFGEGWFDAYKAEENPWDEAFVALLEEEAALKSRYYELSSIGANYTFGTKRYFEVCGDEMVELLVQMIGVRQRIADYWGYPDYPTFATDFYYYRDYTPAQAEGYLSDIRQELVPLYVRLNTSSQFFVDHGYSTEEETYAYVQSMAQNMGKTVKWAFDLLDRAGLCDIGYGKNKYNASFEVYLTMYDEPFILMNPTGTVYDRLTFAHEFGHFCNDYAAGGSYAGTDVLEVFSQAMEYLSLCYADGGSDLTRLKMWDSLCMLVEQSAFASFESRMYELEGEELTAENLRTLYDQVAQEYGFDSVGYDDREFVTVTHFYTNPMYVISYVVSNDAAMQFYQLEQAESGAGLQVLEDNLKTEAYYFLAFLEEAGLESPFVPGRVAKIRETLEQALE